MHHRICPSLRQWLLQLLHQKSLATGCCEEGLTPKQLKLLKGNPLEKMAVGATVLSAAGAGHDHPQDTPPDLMRHQQHLLQEWAWSPKVPTIWKILGSFIQIMQTDFFFLTKRGLHSNNLWECRSREEMEKEGLKF